MTEAMATGHGLARVAAKPKTFPVMEIFGPTIQGEGALAGAPTYFVRFGGCDWRCSWCDSLHAVIPAEVRKNAEQLGAGDIVRRVGDLVPGPEWVTLSGGNPALLELGEVVRGFQNVGMKVAVETQGSRWRDWLGDVGCLTISPKPPSSGMHVKGAKQLPGFMEQASLARPTRHNDALKIVVFDQADLDWSLDVFRTWPTWPRFLSCGTVVGEPLADTADRYRWLCEAVAASPALARHRVLPQLHVIAWGHARGV